MDFNIHSAFFVVGIPFNISQKLHESKWFNQHDFAHVLMIITAFFFMYGGLNFSIKTTRLPTKPVSFIFILKLLSYNSVYQSIKDKICPNSKTGMK